MRYENYVARLNDDTREATIELDIVSNRQRLENHIGTLKLKKAEAQQEVINRKSERVLDPAVIVAKMNTVDLIQREIEQCQSLLKELF